MVIVSVSTHFGGGGWCVVAYQPLQMNGWWKSFLVVCNLKNLQVWGYPLSPLNFVIDQNILISVCV